MDSNQGNKVWSVTQLLTHILREYYLPDNQHTMNIYADVRSTEIHSLVANVHLIFDIISSEEWSNEDINDGTTGMLTSVALNFIEDIHKLRGRGEVVDAGLSKMFTPVDNQKQFDYHIIIKQNHKQENE